MRLALERLTDNSMTARNFQKIQAQWIKGPAQARVYNSANISATNVANTTLTFDSERYDFGDFHSTASNTSRLTAPTDGLYAIGANVRFTANGTGFREVDIVVNGSVTIATTVSPVSSAVVVTDMQTHTQYQLAAGDYVEVRVFQNSGAALNVLAAANFSPEFWIVRLGSQG